VAGEVVTKVTLLRSTSGSDEVYRLGEFTSYHDAEPMVDSLSGGGFPAERVHIVGAGPHSVEQGTGRVTAGRAGLIGAGLGAWLGIVTGLVVGVLLPGAPWLSLLQGALLTGAGAGAIVGFMVYWATDGRRDSASTTGRQAQRYAVEVGRAHASHAVQALDRR
jgi:hypothetical protein